jgi:predicted amidohydrolase
VLVWALWCSLGRDHEWKQSELLLDVTEQLANDSVCSRNIVGIQPYMFTSDYTSEAHFYNKLNGYFEAANLAGYFKDRTIVLLPEYLGTWLVIDQEKSAVAEASTIQNALALMVVSNPVKFSRQWFYGAEEDRAAASIFRMKAEEMARIYSTTFKFLATAYHVTINAGSIVLPGPRVENNDILVDTQQPLNNVSFVFNPDGSIQPSVVRKSFPIGTELPFIQASPLADLPVFDLPMGKTVVLVCADSWYPASYQRAKELGAEIILVGSYCSGTNTMSQSWKGYDGQGLPTDVDPEDISRLREGEAWVKYALPGRIAQAGVATGMNIFLRGELWDLGTDGQPFAVAKGARIEARKSDQAGIWNLCF